MKAALPLLVFLFTQAFSAVRAQEKPVVVDDGFDYRVLGRELQMFEDVTGHLTLEQALTEEYSQVENKRPNFGFSKGALWVRTDIENYRTDPTVKFQINQPQLDTVGIYVLDGGELVAEYLMGQAFPFSYRKYDQPNFLIDINIPMGESRQVYLRIATGEQITLPVYVATPEGAMRMDRTSTIWFGIYFGLIVAMALYNLFVYFTVRDLSYLFYVVYTFAVGATQAVLEGFFDRLLWPDNPWLAMRSVYLFTAIVSLTSLTFVRRFLKTRTHAPIFHRIGHIFAVYFSVLLFLSFFEVNPTLHISAQMGIGSLSIYIFVASIKVYRAGFGPAKFFLIAWVVVLLGILVYALKDAGILESNPFTNYLLMFGSALEAILLSLALADRINILKREHSESQERALRISLENERIVKEQNVLLEDKVKARTADLENSNEQLNGALNDLRSTQTQLVDAEKMASLGQLSAGIAHEINNPINFVGANVEPLQLDIQDMLKVLNMYESINSEEAFMSEKAKIESFKEEIDFKYVLKEIDELLRGIRHGAERTADIVSSLKNFSRLDETELRPFDLNEGMESTLMILSNEVPGWLEMDVELGDIPEVECLGGKINQVFLNIINNGLQAYATQANHENKVYRIRSWHDEENVYFSLADNAGGMTEETRKKIFDPFYTTKDVGKGTGLGMSISFKILKAHGGTIEVESEEGVGSNFTITLPIKGQLLAEENI